MENNVIMANEEKALKIATNYVLKDSSTFPYRAALDMAEWKEKQLIEKACEWLNNNTISVINDVCTYTASSNDISKEEFVEEFKKAMEE